MCAISENVNTRQNMRAISENERGSVCTISEDVDSRKAVYAQSVRISIRERQCVHNQ